MKHPPPAEILLQRMAHVKGGARESTVEVAVEATSYCGRECIGGTTELCHSVMPRFADVIFFDGECGLCHGAVRFILRHDREGRFRFAPLQGRTFIEGISETERRRLPDSLVVAQDDQRLLVRSDGVVYVLEQLGGCWWALGRMLAWLPRPFRDGLYDAIAERRARLFSRPGRECPVMEAELRRRFDP